jgi:peptidoglycan/xylan/chitin deacetylase (PgdA/CDA1 family)
LFEALYSWLCDRPNEHEMRQTIRDLAARYDVDIRSLCQELCMSWAELAELASDPLCTIGAHSVSHSRLKKLSTEAAASEMRSSAIIIEAALGMQPRHFSYPGGDPASAGPREFGLADRLGFKIAVTTCPVCFLPGIAIILRRCRGFASTASISSSATFRFFCREPQPSYGTILGA